MCTAQQTTTSAQCYATHYQQTTPNKNDQHGRSAEYQPKQSQ